MNTIRRWWEPGRCVLGLALLVAYAAPARADEIWVMPTLQQDTGGFETSSNFFWPVSAVGAVRFAWAIPNDLQTFQSAKVALIPGFNDGASSVNILICAAQQGDVVGAPGCAGPFAQPFTSLANQLVEVEIGTILASRIGTAGANYLAVIAYTTPSTGSDHIVGLRFRYQSKAPSGAATLGANTFTGTQTAPAFAGDGSALTNLPFPSNAATLGANTFTGTQTATAFAGNGAGLTDLPFPSNAATLGANTFTGTQTAPAFVGNGAGLTSLPFPSNAATLGANTFTGIQTAPAFAGDGSALTNLPFPINAATLGANTFAGAQTAPLFSGTFVGNGSGLFSLPFPAGAATLGANTFTATQTIHSGDLDLEPSTATTGNITKSGSLFLHNFGTGNVFLGVLAGNTTMGGAGQNVAIGTLTFHANMFGAQNAAVGYQALLNSSSGALNTAIGWQTLLSTTSGSNNTAVGAAALINANAGLNTAIGFSALSGITSGSNNLALGGNAGTNSTTGSNNIYLGANVQGSAGEQNTMYLGKVGQQTRTLIAGVRGTTTVNADAVPVVIDSAGQLGTISSSARFKEDIHDMGGASRRLLQLRPVTFRYTQPFVNGAKPIQYGLIAEEVAVVFPELAVRDAEGRVETVHYETLNVLLLNELQQQQEKIEALERKLDELLARAAPPR